MWRLNSNGLRRLVPTSISEDALVRIQTVRRPSLSYWLVTGMLDPAAKRRAVAFQLIDFKGSPTLYCLSSLKSSVPIPTLVRVVPTGGNRVCSRFTLAKGRAAGRGTTTKEVSLSATPVRSALRCSACQLLQLVGWSWNTPRFLQTIR